MQSLSNSLLSAFLFFSTCTADSLAAPTAVPPTPASKIQQFAAPSSQEPAAASQSSPSGPAQPKPAPGFAFGLEEGTPVPLKLARELSSAKEAPGNRVDFEVAEDIKVNGLAVIPKGEMAWGTIVDAKPRRRLGRAGKLDVRIDEVRLADGERVPLRASQESKGKGRSGAMTGAIIASGVLFFQLHRCFFSYMARMWSSPKGHLLLPISIRTLRSTGQNSKHCLLHLLTAPQPGLPHLRPLQPNPLNEPCSSCALYTLLPYTSACP